MLVVFSGHSMMSMRQMSFKSPEKLGIRWKNWSYPTCRHEILILESLGLSPWKTQTGNEGRRARKKSAGRLKKMDGCKESNRKGFWQLWSLKARVPPQKGLVSVCVCVTVNQYCTYTVSGAIIYLYSYRKRALHFT